VRKAAVAALAVLLLSGCADLAGTHPLPGESLPPPPSARDLLLAALPDEGAGPFAFRVTDGEVTLSGVMDAAHDAASVSFAVPMEPAGRTMMLRLRTVDDLIWFKAGPGRVGGLPAGWVVVDTDRLDDALTAQATVRVAGPVGDLLSGVTRVWQTSSVSFAGVLDLTLAEDDVLLDAAEVAALGKAASAVRFTATVDDEGRLSTVVLTVPAPADGEALRIEVTYSGYGTTRPLLAPAARTEAPDRVYRLLGA
jgi:hypothetical protein